MTQEEADKIAAMVGTEAGCDPEVVDDLCGRLNACRLGFIFTAADDDGRAVPLPAELGDGAEELTHRRVVRATPSDVVA